MSIISERGIKPRNGYKIMHHPNRKANDGGNLVQNVPNDAVPAFVSAGWEEYIEPPAPVEARRAENRGIQISPEDYELLQQMKAKQATKEKPVEEEEEVEEVEATQEEPKVEKSKTPAPIQPQTRGRGNWKKK